MSCSGSLWCLRAAVAWTSSLATVAGCTDRSVTREPECVLRAFAANSGEADHQCALAEDGSLWCWGRSAEGQLGVDDDEASDSLPGPRPLAHGEWRDAAVGREHTCAIESNGALWCWGGNGFGQLGLGTSSDTPHAKPERLAPDQWLQIAAGEVWSCGLRAPGTLWCWGGNEFGQLGLDREDEIIAMPTQVGDAEDWQQVTLGSSHGCGLRVDGAMWCWGDNGAGQLGQGVALQRFPVPVQVGTRTDWELVRTGASHTCALADDGSLWCWGHWGQGPALGHGVEPDPLPVNYEPRQVGDATDWIDLAVGFSHTCARKSDLSLWCWGQNIDGELGVGSVGDVSTPTQLVGDDWIDVSAGGTFGCAIARDGSPHCWGFVLGFGDAASEPLLREPAAVDCPVE